MATSNLIRGKRKFKKLNDFIEHSDYDVLTKRVKDKEGRKRGKVLLFNDTVDEFVNELQHDCKHSANEDHAMPGSCEKETMREDTADFCLFGKSCISDAVYKKIDEKFKTEEHKDYLETLTDEEIQAIIDDEAIF